MTHIHYPKIHRLGKEEVEGILDYPVTVQEKIDGANASIWLEDGEIKLGTRNNEVEDFRGLREYVENHTGIQKFESQEGKHLDKSHTPRVSQTAYHDMLEEEIWSIQKEVPKIDFKKLKKIATKKAVKIFHDVLEGSDEVSVAYD